MLEHPSNIQLAEYGRRTLDAHELLAIDRHLSSCDVCYVRFTGLLRSAADLSIPGHKDSLIQPIEEPFHLDYDQHLAPYVDGTTNDIDLEIVESHVLLCSDCAEDLRDLQEFSRQAALEIGREQLIVGPSRWKRWLLPRQLPQLWNLHPTGNQARAIVVFGLVLTVGVSLWITYRNSASIQQPDRTPPAEDQKKTPIDRATAPGLAPAERSTETTAAQPAREDEEQEDPWNAKKADAGMIVLNDGEGQVTLNRRGEVDGLELLPSDLRRSLERVLRTRKLPITPAVANLARGAGRLRGSDEHDAVLPMEPVGTVIESDQPTFRWIALQGANDYRVTIYDSRLQLIEDSGPLAASEWTIAKPLHRGGTYSWQISAVKDGKTVISPKPPAGEARFRVLDSQAVTVLENAKKLHGRSHLVMGVLYWKQGLIAEAENEFEALLHANRKSPVAKDLLQSLRSLSHR